MTPEEFKAVRKRLGRTQATMAERLGVSRRAVQTWEEGVIPVPAATAELILIIAGLRPAVVEVAQSDQQPVALPDPDPDPLLPI